MAPITVVSDPDELLTEESIFSAIRENGFDILTFDDPVAFRYAYEKRIRDNTSMAATVVRTSSDHNYVAYDLINKARQVGRLLSFSVSLLFPQLSSNVVAELDKQDLDILYDILQNHHLNASGENATKDFILRYVYGMDSNLITTSADLLRVLLRHHYSVRTLPPSLENWFVSSLLQSGKFPDWPLEKIVKNRSGFYEFLQERWPIFLERFMPQVAISAESRLTYNLKIGGPTNLPFEHEDVRVYIDNLFIDGMLTPSNTVPKEKVKGTWVEVGVSGDFTKDMMQRFERLTDTMETAVPDETAHYRVWLDFAKRWGEWSTLRWSLPHLAMDVPASDRSEKLHDRVEQAFQQWMLDHYGSLHSLSHRPRPVMVHHIPRFLAHERSLYSNENRIALVVVDGMTISQWSVLRTELERQSGDCLVHEDAVFAWVPTLTSVSRQAIFSGEMPFIFAKSLGTTQKEESLWRKFWEDRQVKRNQVAYLVQKKYEDDNVFFDRIREAADKPKCSILGLVLGKVDRMIHGTVTGSSGLHSQVAHWAESGFFVNLVEYLLDEGFAIQLTSDHGNIEGVGIGKPNVGTVADERGVRVHVFSDALVREQVSKQFPQTITWLGIGLPADYKPLIASNRGAFVTPGSHVLGHGGISLEEVVVPFIRLERRR